MRGIDRAYAPYNTMWLYHSSARYEGKIEIGEEAMTSIISIR